MTQSLSTGLRTRGRGRRRGQARNVAYTFLGEQKVERRPNVLATKKLLAALEKLKVNTTTAKIWEEEMRALPQLRYMNMPMLASALSFLSLYQVVNPQTFVDDNIWPLIAPFFPDPDYIAKKSLNESDLAVIKTRFKANLARYIQAVVLFRSQRGG
jgi:hypothetical protein